MERPSSFNSVTYWNSAPRSSSRTRRSKSRSSPSSRALSRLSIGALRHLDETLARLAAHALRRRIGRQQFGMLRLQIAQLPHQRVIFGVADFGLVQDIVQALVMAQPFPQLLDAGGNIFRHRRYHYSLVR